MLFDTGRDAKAQSHVQRLWAKERIFCDGDAYFSEIIAAIKLAKKTVFLESYIFEYDSLGKRIIDALLVAKNNGVEVKVLIDGVGSANFISRSMNDVRSDGLEIRVHHPLPWQIVPQMNLMNGFGIGTVLKFFSYTNSRNHRKMVVIDGALAFVGSLNVSEVHLLEFLRKNAWHDVGAAVSGGDCQLLDLVFLKVWNKAWRTGHHGVLKPSLRFAALPRLLQSPLVVRNDGRRLRRDAFARRLDTIRSARNRVWIANAYFVPSGQFLRALMAAARRGVDVRVLLPRISDIHFMPWVARAFYESLIRHGVRVFEFSPRVLHAKVMLSDDFLWVGSSNLNHRSLLHDLELDVVLSSVGVIQRAEEIFLNDFLNSQEVDKLSPPGHTILQRVAVRLLLYFRRLL